MPPPIAFFTGSTISAAEIDGLIAIRPLRGHRFTTPPGTNTLYVPIATLVRTSVHRIDDSGWSELAFHGEFSRVSHPSPVALGPLEHADADALARKLAERYTLPRLARNCDPHEMHALTEQALITVLGAYTPGHFEAANFERVMISGPPARGLTAGRRYRVTGFFTPVRRDPDHPRPVGYSGSRLEALAISDPQTPPTFEPDPHAPATAHLSLAARSATCRESLYNQEAAAIFELGGGRSQRVGRDTQWRTISSEWSRTPGVAMVVLDGVGGQSSGDISCEHALAALAPCLGDALLPLPTDRQRWLGAAVERASQHMSAENGGHRGAATAVALIVADELHVAHLGDARAYILRDGQLTCLTEDHTLHRDFLAAGVTPEELAQIPHVLTRMLGFTPGQPTLTTFALQTDDIVLLCTRGLHLELTAGEITSILRDHPEPADACAALEARADAAGGRENVTVIVARVAPPHA